MKANSILIIFIFAFIVGFILSIFGLSYGYWYIVAGILIMIIGIAGGYFLTKRP